MAFEIGDKVLTSSGLYIGKQWRERGLKGKIVDISDEFGGLLTVKFKGIEEKRFLRPEYVILRGKRKRPFKEGNTVTLIKDVHTSAGTFSAGADAEVIGLVPDSNLVEIKFLYGGAELAVVEEALSKTEKVEEAKTSGPLDVTIIVTPEEEDSGDDQVEAEESPEVLEALQLVLDRIEEIKTLLTTKPQNEFVVNVHPSNGLTEEEVAAAVQAEEPAPEPVFKKAKKVEVGDLVYTEGGAYDKVHRAETKSSGYTSLYGVFGNRIAEVPAGRVLQVLEEVA